MTDRRIVRFVVRGRVQGVGFRAFVEETAFDHGLKGWVRNRRDGSVEAVAAGTPTAVGALIEAVRRGPRAARVDGVDITEADEEALSPSHGGFSSLPTV